VDALGIAILEPVTRIEAELVVDALGIAVLEPVTRLEAELVTDEAVPLLLMKGASVGGLPSSVTKN